MRIIAGTAKRMPLQVPAEITRPTTDRVRESLFSILTPIIADSRVLDLFAGSGALALESLSRGASEALLVDNAHQASQAIEKNITTTKLPARLIQRDVTSFLKSNQQSFDLIFADPPYDSDHVSQLLDSEDLQRALSSDGYLIFETPAPASKKAPAPESQHFRLLENRSYGKSRILIYKKNSVNLDNSV